MLGAPNNSRKEVTKVAVYALLLNASFEPIKVVSARRAVGLLLSGKAESVDDGGRQAFYRSTSQSIAVPSVIRLKYQVKIPYRATVPLCRAAVLARDDRTCQYCFRHGDTMDHVQPRSRGGKHAWENVVTACKRCNSNKDDQLLSEIGWTLVTTPYAPKAWFYVVFKFELDPAWAPYLPST
jgi:5-methylcytosine-specific restriction endonuclease McrA